MNGVWIAITTVGAFSLARQVRDASPRQMLRTALNVIVLVVLLSAPVIGLWMGLRTP
ncbi:MAG TPA: hypothetical protein VFI15_04610 [Candidatus Limnocylindrales bacterium]|nr:hypothetical protein [Candidatus Limnocylindrales bacterium]